MKTLPAILVLLAFLVLLSSCTRSLELGLLPEHNLTDGSVGSGKDKDSGKNKDASHLDESDKAPFNPATN